MEPQQSVKGLAGLGKLFVALRVRYFEHLHLTNFRENHQNVRYIDV